VPSTLAYPEQSLHHSRLEPSLTEKLIDLTGVKHTVSANGRPLELPGPHFFRASKSQLGLPYRMMRGPGIDLIWP
jgi:hypothetical protein